MLITQKKENFVPKILIDYQIFSQQAYGGVSRYFSEIAWRINRINGCSVRIFCPLYINKYLNSLDRSIVRGLFISRLPNTGRMRMLVNALLFHLYNHTCNDFDIIHETQFYSRPVRNKISVITVYDMIHEFLPAFFNINDKTSHFKARSIKRSDCIICISNNTKKDLLEIIDVDPSKVFVTHLGVSRLPMPVSKQGIQFTSTPFLLYVGKRGGYKNFGNFLKAFSESKNLRNNFKIVCFGGGGFNKDEMKLINSHGLDENRVVQISGDDRFLSCLYRNASAFVYPSLYEGFGIPVLEAMSCDCPVICSNTGSLPEIVGNAGEFFDPNDLEYIISSLEQVLFSEARSKELISLGRKRCQLFSWEKCAQETKDIYMNLL